MDDSLGEKLGMPSSILVRNRNPSSDRVRFRMKKDFELKSAAFLDFLKDAFKAFPNRKPPYNDLHATSDCPH